MRITVGPDSIQIGLFVFAAISVMGGFWGYCEAHFAKSENLTAEISERQRFQDELKTEVDQLYLKLIPGPEQVQLRYNAAPKSH